MGLDEVFELLSNERRRYALYFLKQQDGPVVVEQLVETIAEWEAESVEEIDGEEMEDVELTLVHHHLPKSAEVEFVEYDPENREIQASGIPPEVNALVTIARLIEQPASEE